MRSNSANKFFDGLAAEKPMLINYGGWHADLLIERRAGLVLWGKTKKEAAQLIIEAVNDKEYMKEMSENSSLLADTYFDRDVLALQFEKVLMFTVDKTPNLPQNIAPGEYK
jgi:hypothetical protein